MCNQGLGLSTFVVGLVTGSQFAASLISRVWSGHYSDRRGAKRAVVVGLLTAVVAGLLYLVSLRFVGTPWLSVTILLFGRALLGGAESFVITGAVSWGLALAGPENAGRVIAWVGDVDVRRPCVRGAGRHHALRDWRIHRRRSRDDFGSAHHGVAGYPPCLPLQPSVAPGPGSRRCSAAVWLPGFGSALSSLGFGAMIAFSSLLSAERGWSPVWLSFSAFAIA